MTTMPLFRAGVIKALVIKELRENAWLALLALLAFGWMVNALVHGDDTSGLLPSPSRALVFAYPTRTSEVPFTGKQFTSTFVLITGALAIALGLRQSLNDSRQGTYLFLLHRPWPRQAIFLTKLAVGFGLLAICSALPILIYALWTARPGNIAAPFEWSMTRNAWWHWGTLPVLYLGAFLSGLRPAAWFGTRLAPLVAALTAVMLLQVVSWRWGLGVLSLALTFAALVGAISFVARTRDYS